MESEEKYPVASNATNIEFPKLLIGCTRSCCCISWKHFW